jgi:radical SAM superfamily enzyme YgiQ (UPF0313 family)
MPFPFFLAISASNARVHGHSVKIIDALAEGTSVEAVLKKALLFAPDMVLAETSTPSLDNDIEILLKMKEKLPEAAYVCSGSHSPEYALELMKKSEFPDFWLSGEYDLTASMLADAIGAKHSTRDIPGIMTATTPSVPVPAEIKALDTLPPPLFEQLPVVNYSDPVCGLPAPSAQSWLSRGCPYKCSFCVWPQVIYGNRKYRYRSIDRALDEIEILIRDYGCESFYFDDDTTNIGENRMKCLAEKILERKLDRYPWAMMARADCMTPGMIKELARAGMYAVKYGVESISPELLNACSKGTEPEKLRRALTATAKAGIKMHLTFTFGLPGETTGTIKQTMDFAMEIAPESAQFSVCTPFPGTAFYSESIEKGWLTENNWGKFLGSGEQVVINTPKLSSDELKNAYADAMRQWDDFLSERMEKRRDALKRKIHAEIAKGRKFNFKGEKAFAGFILNDKDIGGAISKDISGDFTVIVSRHDEEKIFRRMIRAGKKRENILRLYN